MKTNGSVYTHILRISILEVCRFLCSFREKNVVVITCWCNFRQQRSVDSILVNFSSIFSNSQNKISNLFLFYFCKIHASFVLNQ